MDFTVKIAVLLLFVAEVYGKSIRLEDGTGNATGVNTLVLPEACEFNGTFHPLDSLFTAPDNPCRVCECNENWTGTISDTSCHEVECDELDDIKSNEGCIPVYDEMKCCVIDFYCRDNVASNTTEGIENGNEFEKDNEIENSNTTEENDEVVCPTPLCADESCRIEIPPGQFCPTCICEGVQEKNDFETSELSERQPLEAQNASEDVQVFLITVPLSRDSNGAVPLKGNSFKEESEYDGDSERVDVLQTQALEQGNEERIPREMENSDSSTNVIQDGMETEPRRKRSINSQTASTSLPQQQRWAVLEDNTQNVQQSSDSDERERENSNDSSEDYSEMKIFRQGESETAESTNEISDLYDEESVVWEKIVPGCPTPLCENSECRIGIPPGHQCPTCICNRRIRQP